MSKNIKLNNTDYNGVSTVQLPTTDGGTATFKDTDEITTPTGTKTITENGTYDVSGYASAEVNVESESGGSDEFVGMKILEFHDEYYGIPKVVDLRSLQDAVDKSNAVDGINPICGLMCMFMNNNVNVGGGVFNKMTDVYLPSGLKQLSASIFDRCNLLVNIHGDFSSVTTIGNYAFRECKALTEIPYMPNLESIAQKVFLNCIGLTEVKLYKTATIQSNAFNGCTNITDIYVPWAEGEVDGADTKWGATNSTIHYNTVYDENHNPIV